MRKKVGHSLRRGGRPSPPRYLSDRHMILSSVKTPQLELSVCAGAKPLLRLQWGPEMAWSAPTARPGISPSANCCRGLKTVQHFPFRSTFSRNQ
jgi:hypothetical protein